MKKLEKRIDDVMESLKKDQSAFVMCCDDEGHFFYSYCMRENEIGAGIASILSDAFDDDNVQAQRAADGIMAGLMAVINSGGKSSDKIMHALAPVAAKHALKSLKKLQKQIEDIGEDEDCETCEHNRECQLPSAIKYRKENGIPAPRKRGRGKRNNEERGS